MVTLVPTLSPKGWLKSISDKCDQCIQYFYLSQYSQTKLYRGSVKPLAWLVQQFGNNAKDIRVELERALQDYFSRYFEHAEVAVTAPVTEDDGINLRVTIMVRDDGIDYDLCHVITVANAKVLSIFDVINQGYIQGNHPSLNNLIQ